MSHRTLIGGTAYEVSGGKTLIDGTAYSIKNGKTLVGGTAYEVGFGVQKVIVRITGYSYYSAYVTIDGTYYIGYDKETGEDYLIEVAPGDVIYMDITDEDPFSTFAIIIDGDEVSSDDYYWEVPDGITEVLIEMDQGTITVTTS